MANPMQTITATPRAGRRRAIAAAFTAAALATAALAAAAFGALAVLPGRAETPAAKVNVLAGQGIAVGGYDVVAYFVEGRPMRGRADLAVERDGARWLFASDAHKRLFEAEPERYLPAYGGYCAYGVSRGYLVTIDPDAWTIANGRLYLNYDRGVREQWLKDVRGYVAKADGEWPKLTGSVNP